MAIISEGLHVDQKCQCQYDSLHGLKSDFVNSVADFKKGCAHFMAKWTNSATRQSLNLRLNHNRKNILKFNTDFGTILIRDVH